MNRYLLAGSAAVALVVGASAANAQNKFDLKIGGDAYFEAGFVSQDNDSGLRSTEFANRMRIVVQPVAKADNGLEYGARLRFRAAGSGTDNNVSADRAFIYATGSFGQVRLGSTNEFNDDTAVSTPIDYLPLGLFDRVNSYIGATNGSNTTINGRFAGADVGSNGGVAQTVTGNSLIWATLDPVGGNSTKVVYYSPRFSGLQLGAAYTPRKDSFYTDVNRVKNVTTAAAQASGAYQDIFEIGANFNDTFGGVTVKASAAYTGGTTSKSSAAADSFKNLSAWQAGAQIGYAGFVLGGGYVDFGKSGQNTRYAFTGDVSNWTVGVQYTTGPIVVGANYKHGEDPGSTTLAGKRKLDVYELGAGYTVAPGLALQAQYDYFTAKSDKVNTVATGNDDDKGHVVILRSVLAF